MTYLEAILQGILQGLTEFLPVSSSGHLSLFQHFTGNSGETGIFFSLMLHLGTLLAVFIAFRKTIWQLILEFLSMVWDIVRGRFSWKERSDYRNMLVMLILSCLPLVLVLIFKDFYESFATDDDIIWEGIFFLVTALLLYIGDHVGRRNKGPGEITPKDALLVGLFQAVAPLPGISRSGSTISGGMISGMDRDTAVQYSFILGIPVILASSLSELMEVSSGDLQVDLLPVLLGMAVAAVVGLLAIKLVRYISRTDKFGIFVWYTAILGVLVCGIGVFERVVGMNIVQYFTH